MQDNSVEQTQASNISSTVSSQVKPVFKRNNMSWHVIPLETCDLDYFERQKELFSKWIHLFDEDWLTMR